MEEREDGGGGARGALRLDAEDLKRVGVLFAAFLALHAYELTNFQVTVDDEILALDDVWAFADIGRWLHPALRAVWPQPVAPWGPLLLAGLALSTAFFWLHRALREAPLDAAGVLVFAAFVLFPAFPSQFEFAANVLPVGVGMLAAAGAVALCAVFYEADAPASRRWRAGAASALLLAVAGGAYQSLALVYPTGLAALALARLLGPGGLDGRTLARAVGGGVLVLAAGGAIYLLSAAGVLALSGREASDYLLRFQAREPSERSAADVMRLGLWTVRSAFLSFYHPFGPLRFGYALMIAGTLVAALWTLRRSWRDAVLAAGLIGIVCAMTALPSLAADRPLAIRTHLPAAAAIAALGCILLRASSSSAMADAMGRAMRAGAVALVALAALQGLYVLSAFQARAAIAQRHDQALIAALAFAIEREAAGRAEAPISLLFQGVRQVRSVYPALPGTTSGFSIFEWDGGDPVRQTAALNLFAGGGFALAGPELTARLAPIFGEMPSWPAEGSVRAADGVVLVKLSD